MAALLPVAPDDLHAPAPSSGPRRALASGWPDFDDLHLVAPGRVTLLDVRTARQGTDVRADDADDVVLGLLAGAVAAGKEGVVVDGGNWLDAYRLGDRARAHGITREAVLSGVRVARGFTAYQLQALVEDTLANALEEAGRHVGVVVVASLPTMYMDVDVPPSEARILLERALAVLRELARVHDVPVVVTNPRVSPGARHVLRQVLDAGADETVLLHAAPGGGLVVRAPKRGVVARVTPPGARQRRLPEYAVDVPEDAAPAAPVETLPDAATRRAIAAWAHVPRRAGEWRAWQQRQEEVAGAGAH